MTKESHYIIYGRKEGGKKGVTEEEGTERKEREEERRQERKDKLIFIKEREMTKEIIFHPTHTVKVIMKTKNNMENVRVTLAEKYILKSWEETEIWKQCALWVLK